MTHSQSCCHTPPVPGTSPPTFFGIRGDFFPNHPTPSHSKTSEVPPAPRSFGELTAAPLPDIPRAAFRGSILSPLSNLFLRLHHKKNSRDLGSGPGIFAYCISLVFRSTAWPPDGKNRRSLQHLSIRLSATPPCSRSGNRGGNEVVFQTPGHFHRDRGKRGGKNHMEPIKGRFLKFNGKRFLCGPLEKRDCGSRNSVFPWILSRIQWIGCHKSHDPHQDLSWRG